MLAISVIAVALLSGCGESEPGWFVQGPKSVRDGAFGRCMGVSTPEYRLLAVCQGTFDGNLTCFEQDVGGAWIEIPFREECDRALDAVIEYGESGERRIPETTAEADQPPPTEPVTEETNAPSPADDQLSSDFDPVKARRDTVQAVRACRRRARGLSLPSSLTRHSRSGFKLARGENDGGVSSVACADFTGDGTPDMAVTLFGGGTAADVAWFVFLSDSSEWKLALARMDVQKLALAIADGDLFETTPIYSQSDPNCCPSAWRHVRYSWNGSRFVKTASWQSSGPDG